jgi:outer membrane protein assembly factor BamE
MFLLRAFLISTLALSLCACQTSMVRAFEKLHPGMDKHQVLEVVGTPNTKTRLHSQDRWIYRFYDDGIRYDREVHFLDGMSIYIGEPLKPVAAETAQEKDLRNEQQELIYEQEKVKKNKSVESSYSQYEAQVKGQDKVNYLPQFIEVK